MRKYSLTLIGLLLLSQSAYAKTLQDVLDCKKHADCPYIFDVYKGDRVFKKAVDKFKKLPAAAQDGWITDGTAGPASPVILAGHTYALFNVCKPHECGDNHYALAYDPESHKLFGLHTVQDIKIPVGSPSAAIVEMLTSYDDYDGELHKKLEASDAIFPVEFYPQ